MDSFTLKKSFIWVMLLLLCGMTLKAANNPQVVVKLDKPGSLISKVSFYTTNLKVLDRWMGRICIISVRWRAVIMMDDQRKENWLL